MSAGKKYVVKGRPPTSTSTVSPFLTNSTESAAELGSGDSRRPNSTVRQSRDLNPKWKTICHLTFAFCHLNCSSGKAAHVAALGNHKGCRYTPIYFNVSSASLRVPA